MGDDLNRPIRPDYPLRVVGEMDVAWMNGAPDAVPPPRLLSPAEKAARDAAIDASIEEEHAAFTAADEARRQAEIDADPELAAQRDELGLLPAWQGVDRERERLAAAKVPWPEPENRGTAVLSAQGDVEYVVDLGVRPGRILLVGAEEGTGKSYAIDSELGIRLACAGGAFAGTWPIRETVPVLVLSEMHADDDHAREETVLAALEKQRADLDRNYWRLSLMTAAGGAPALTVPEWRTWITGWMAEHGVRVLVVDTATGATAVDPWGKAIQDVYRNLRGMLAEYPELAIVLIVHLKKPSGRGERRISDVLGEWGRWCDVVLMLEADGATRTKISTYKRVRTPRRIVAVKRDGLLVEPIDLADAKGPKVPTDKVLAAIRERPGIGYADLGKKLDVSKDTAGRYVAALGDLVDVAKTGPRGAAMVFVRTDEELFMGVGEDE